MDEGRFEDKGNGLVPVSGGWSILNLRDARWFDGPGRHSVPLTGCDEYEAENFYPMLGFALRVLEPGAPMSVYHWETEAEDFLVLAGTPLVVIDGEEHQLKPWDFVHCPPEATHVFVGAGDAPSVIIATSSRQFQKDGPWGFYVKDETAAIYGASPPETTQENSVADQDWVPSVESRYQEGWLPEVGWNVRSDP
ncbi:MAG TPA: cupin domain-containing protein [Gaiellaceae bacterium]|nr:cupin domain-containing protein [Gaiellaceae bacterium]